ncbi:DUF484 family protein [Thauera sinica]|uniref:DUF484 family protein n=1 Tax=Thauera sinica TaxID=2665146 RepID=A0ABW1APB0_9RHOO|nr:DUF484 family protein [Thauera sp. K11]ATE62259.1 hypothetical protein CCZ27_21795 [Thauera sp. K11]
MNPEDVARYLRDNPDFLNEHGELFTRLTVPHPRHGGQAISLAERQLHALRDKIGLLEQKLSELIRFGEENDDISEKVHRLAVALLEAHSLDGVRHAVFSSLQEDFSVPHVALRTWLEEAAEGGPAPVGEAVRRHVEGLRHAYCGVPDNIEVLGWFGEAAPHVRSMAMIPLNHGGEPVGVLALGSAETERFYPEMGTLYLGRIGDLVAAALACTSA